MSFWVYTRGLVNSSPSRPYPQSCYSDPAGFIGFGVSNLGKECRSDSQRENWSVTQSI